MNTEQLLAAIDEVRHDVDLWDHNIANREYSIHVGPFKFSVRTMGDGWMWEVSHMQAGSLTAQKVDTAAEGRRLALDYATLYLQANVNA